MGFPFLQLRVLGFVAVGIGTLGFLCLLLGVEGIVAGLVFVVPSLVLGISPVARVRSLFGFGYPKWVLVEFAPTVQAALSGAPY